MKITDLALIFIVILFPIVIIVFINTSFVLKSEKQEMYYKEVIGSAIEDAVTAMKRVENEDTTIDYGYSSIIDNKVSINADTAINTFKNSLFNTFNIKGNNASEKTLMTYIPVIAIFDYDGVYIHSAELSADATSYEFITKPKRMYSYTYTIVKEISDFGETKYVYKPYQRDTSVKNQMVYQVSYTMDNYITLTISRYNSGKLEKLKTISFYLDDTDNINNLIYGITIPSDEQKSLIAEIDQDLMKRRKEVIAKICMQEVAYAANAHNEYAKMAGIKYNFYFSPESDDKWYETVDSIGMFALVQGISLGNRYLNYKAYGTSDLSLIKRYYLTNPLDKNNMSNALDYYYEKLYHKSDRCEAYLNLKSMGCVPAKLRYLTSKQEAATNGYHACPICKP